MTMNISQKPHVSIGFSAIPVKTLDKMVENQSLCFITGINNYGDKALFLGRPKNKKDVGRILDYYSDSDLFKDKGNELVNVKFDTNSYYGIGVKKGPADELLQQGKEQLASILYPNEVLYLAKDKDIKTPVAVVTGAKPQRDSFI